ncbi:penicillin-binding transpeptidase domain-containing protein [Clostridium arbusti]|uniref:penicillin-binding transpeptidase domain-containing protein n=1 Tax=Clostridium arbusti TaxID=1137848 RepID=UPI000289A065|nr:penicillin-binding transpeptidase domain-containing protein [Clostridium arbusti]
MISNSNFYKTKALQQWTSQITVNAKRGRILDTNGNEFAVSVEAYRIDIDMNTLRQYLKIKGMSMSQLSNKLSSILNMSNDQVSNILYLKSPNGMPVKFATLARKIDKTQADRIDALKIQGFIISSDSKRFYRNNNFLASAMGYVNSDGNGVSGVELSYNKELSGIAGRKILETDNRGNPLPYEDSQYIPPVDGKDVVLTIDQTIQLYAEQAAQKALTDNKAKSVTITVMNPKTGAILAMVNKPDYDPNNPNGNKNQTGEQIAASWKNNAVQNTFEPGSIFKVVTSYAAMSENVVNDDTRFPDPGYAMVDGVRINEWNMVGFPSQTFQDIIKNSSNVGFVKLGVDLLGKDKLFKYINLFGFGQKTGVDLPGESKGIVRSTDKTNKVDLANISFGQGISVTAMQYLAAFNSVANGGTWIRPHIMKEIVHTDSTTNKQVVDTTYNNLGEKKILDPNTAGTLRTYLRKVVTDGVGSAAEVPGLDIAGKTGTAQKSSPNGGYAPGKYMSSFAGMAPASDPKITMLISIDEPDSNNYYAGATAAPVAKNLFNEIFNYMAIK